MRGTGPYPERTFEEELERLRLEDEYLSNKVKERIEDKEEA